MKKEYIALAGMAVALTMIAVTIHHFVGSGTLSGWNGFAGEKNGGSGVYMKYETYETELGGYRIRFDYLAGMKSFEPMTEVAVQSQDFYADNLDSVTVTVVPAKMNADDSRPRTAEEYEMYDRLAVYGDMAAEDVDAADYATGEWTGYSYHSTAEYVDGLKSYTMGYDLFCGDEYIYIFAQGSDGLPADIKNVKIDKM